MEVSKTYFYLGRQSGIDTIRLDHALNRVVEMPQTGFYEGTPGWLEFEPTTATLFAVNAESPGSLQLYDIEAETGALIKKGDYPFYPRIVHLLVTLDGPDFYLFASSYDEGSLAFFKMTTALAAPEQKQVLSFGKIARTHSSSWDAERRLLYVANLALNRVDVLQMHNGLLDPVGEISTPSPRTVHFDPLLDKIYVLTEAEFEDSYLQCFARRDLEEEYSFDLQDSLRLPQRGAALKLDHTYNYIYATAREVGKESVWCVPLTPDGRFDVMRTRLIIPLEQTEPRCLEVTADGRYLMIAANSTARQNVDVLGLDLTADDISYESLYGEKFGVSGYLSSAMVPI